MAFEDSCGHEKIGRIIANMEALLPSASIERRDYLRCRTTYGLLSITYKRINDSNNPEKEYQELQGVAKDLRHRLTNLDLSRSLSRKFQALLDGLEAGIDAALKPGVTIDFVIRGLRNTLEETHDTPMVKREPVKMVHEARLEKIKEELAAECEKNRKLNEEHNWLVLEFRKDQVRERSGTGGPPLRKLSGRLEQ
ncbi:hypothetical protein COCMIDRAFT_6166 [Bipolaris oryzae ATCC 44560]|uniref:Uncharacterized protein n=1 Tax=Bipolaris oryzae ATCC 44560 TaxID=930090 RepID=W6Z3L8_COCMI|nr:uncharacterized protein COCMIDRAFT_6166 [Bipolaris oryzae ATCC 44560]EUC44560.1 hypothetical protein COCMIDRAFT_6166 [Bipolaris oryzae ATCC 44560]